MSPVRTGQASNRRVIAGITWVSTTVETAKGDVMKKLLCALLLALFVGGVLSCKKEEPVPVKPPEKTETPKTE